MRPVSAPARTRTAPAAASVAALPPLPPGYVRADPPPPPAPAWWLRLYGPTGTGDPIAPEQGT